MEQSLPIRFSPHIAVFALRLTLGTVIASALQVAPAMASWPHDGNNLPIAVGYYYHENPVIVSDGAGGAIIAWQENHGAGAAKDIAAQHVLASGIVDPTWPFNGRAICSAVNQQQDPKLVSDGAGGAIIVWEDLRSGTSFDLYAQHVLASGVVDPVWPVDGRAIAVAAGDQFTPVITTDGAGGAIMAWRDARNGVDDDVFAQRITAGGNVVFAANGVNLTSGQPGNQNSPSICPDGFGGAVVAWTDARTFATTQNDIYAQRINSAGFNYWTAGGKVVYSDNQEQEAPIVIQDMTGGFLFVWMDKRGGANFDIYAQRWNQAGTVEWAAPSRPVCVAAGDQTSPSVVADGQGGAQIAWQDARGVSPDIYTQHLLYTGLPDPSAPVDGRALCNATGYQGSPVIAPDGDGGAIVTWTDYFVSNPWADLYSGHVLASGAIDPAK